MKSSIPEKSGGPSIKRGLLDRIKDSLRQSRGVRRTVKWWRSRTTADPGWGRIMARDPLRERVLAAGGTGPRVLLATSIGGYWAGTTLESLLAAALKLRGTEVEVLLCDAVLPACQACEARAWRKIERFARLGPRDGLCGGCFEPGRRLFEGLGVKVRRL